MSNNKKPALRLFFVGMIVLAATELFVRVFLTSPSQQIFDPETGFRYVPHATIFRSKEGGATIHLNGLGLNDDEITHKPEKFQIVALGDSITEAFQVPADVNYTSVAERLNRKLDIINMGRSAAGPLSYPIVLDRIRKIVQPTYIVVQLSPYDVEDLLRPNARVTQDTKTGKIVQVKLQSTQKNLLKQAVRPIIRHSALATYLMRRWSPLVKEVIENFDALGGIKAHAKAPAEKVKEKHQAAMRLAYVLEVLKRTAPVVVLNVPSLDYFQGRRAQISKLSHDERKVFREAARMANVPFIDTSSTLKKVYLETGQPPHGFANHRIGVGHLNPAGHQAVGKSLVSFFDNTLFPNTQP